MEQNINDFFHEFRQQLLAGAEASGNFQLSEFMESFANELIDSGFIEGFEICHYRAQRGIRVDGYWFNDEGVLDLFIADFDSRSELNSLLKIDIDNAFKRLSNFFQNSIDKNLADKLEITSPEYNLSRQILDRKGYIRTLNLTIISERTLGERVQNIPEGEIAGIPTNYQVWDISRLHRLHSSKGHKEALDFNLEEMFENGIPSLLASSVEGAYQAYLMVVPASILATLYEKFGARLLEQNVRTFLQSRGNVNKGIRATIINEPEMFFAYNNGITATAQSVETKMTNSGLVITRIIDLQIVNGGQTTASLFHTNRKDKVKLSKIFVQMKMVVINNEQSEVIVPKISEYANTQNRVNVADFFSNHPYHIRMEEFSRKIWAPATKGNLRDTKWFYERARGQYADLQSKLTVAEQKRFKIEYPKQQMLTKTDLAKFENVWDEHPRWVNLGAQKNFSQYIARIGKEWEKSSDKFNEFYYKRAIARAIIFRATEKIVSSQPWYNGGYRANIVAYTLALLREITKIRNSDIHFLGIWNSQKIDITLESTIATVAKFANDDIIKPPQGISNISEWCKKESCWTRIKSNASFIEKKLSSDFFNTLISIDERIENEKNAKKTQRIDSGIDIQRRIVAIPANEWSSIHSVMSENGLLTPKEDNVLKIAMLIPKKIPNEQQSAVLLDIIDRLTKEGYIVNNYN